MTESSDNKSIIERQLLDMLAKTIGIEAALATSIAEKDSVIETQRETLAARDRRITELEATIADLRGRLALRESTTTPPFLIDEAIATPAGTTRQRFSFDFVRPSMVPQKRKERDNNGPPFFGKPGPVVGHFGIGLPGELGINNTVRGKDGVFR